MVFSKCQLLLSPDPNITHFDESRKAMWNTLLFMLHLRHFVRAVDDTECASSRRIIGRRRKLHELRQLLVEVPGHLRTTVALMQLVQHSRLIRRQPAREIKTEWTGREV